MGGEASKELNSDDIDSIKRNTKFKSSEIKEWHDQFLVEYPSGRINESNFVSMYSQMMPDGDSSRYAKHVFRAYDADGNGEIDFQEFMTTMSVASRGTSEEKLHWSFKMYDINGNGTISRAEATEMIQAIYRMKGDFCNDSAQDATERIFRSLDKHKDDELTEKEFVAGVKGSRTVMELLQAQ